LTSRDTSKRARRGRGEDALEGIRDAAIAAFEEYEFDGLLRTAEGEEFAVEDEAGAAPSDGSPQASGDDAFSGTNNAVAGVDEPDIVKTDGTFIYSVVDYGAVRVVDTRSGKVVAERSAVSIENGDGYESEFRLERLDPRSLDVLDTFAMEGSMVDAHLVDGEVRLAIGTEPQIQPCGRSCSPVTPRTRTSRRPCAPPNSRIGFRLTASTMKRARSTARRSLLGERARPPRRRRLD
jgi:hypothetical protein